MTRHGRVFGWERDGGQRNDDALLQLPRLPLVALAGDIDLRWQFPPIFDQGGDGSCVPQAIAAVIYASHVRAGVDPAQLEVLARKLLWRLGRKERGTELLNRGMSNRQGFRLCDEVGFARERHCPHSLPFNEPPPPEAYRFCVDQQNQGRGRVDYQRISDMVGVDGFLAALDAKLPVEYGVDVSHAFARGDFDPNEPLYQPTPGDKAGGHAMVACGYRVSDGAILTRNSYGTSWGLDGYCWMSQAYMATAEDRWTVLKAPMFSDEVPA